MKTAFLSAIILVSACSTVPKPTPLPLPPKPDMIYITDMDVACVSDDVYMRLAQRDIAYKQYIGRLESVIKSTWSN